MVRELGMDRYTLLYLKMDDQQEGPAEYSSGNSAQCSVAAWMGGGLGENVCVSHQSYRTLCNPMDCILPGSSVGFSRQEYWSCHALL